MTRQVQKFIVAHLRVFFRISRRHATIVASGVYL
jgi:hypothetical protein